MQSSLQCALMPLYHQMLTQGSLGLTLPDPTDLGGCSGSGEGGDESPYHNNGSGNSAVLRYCEASPVMEAPSLCQKLSWARNQQHLGVLLLQSGPRGAPPTQLETRS